MISQLNHIMNPHPSFMKTLRIIAGLIFCCIAVIFASAAQAQSLYWDGTNTTSNSVIEGGTGTWDNSTQNWTQSNGLGNSAWSDGGTAVFGLVTGGTGAYTVALSDTSGFITAGGLVFNTGGYILSGSINGVASAPGAALLYLSGNSTISVAQGQATIAASLFDSGSNTLSVVKSGAGTLVLAADNSQMDINGGIPQQIILNAGTLQTGASAGASVFGNGGNTSLQLNGGTLQLTNATGLNYADNVTVTGNVLVLSDRGVAGAGGTNSFGTLSLSGTLLNVNNGLVSSGVSGLSFGAATLTGSSMILSGNYGTGNLITLASIDGSVANAGLVLGGNGLITVTGSTNLGTGKLTVIGSGTTTFGGVVTTTGTVVLNQGTTGNVTLGGAGSSSATFAGSQSITVNGGTLQLGALAASGIVNRISDTATLTLAGGNLMVTQLTGSNTEAIGTLALGVGFSAINGQNASSSGTGRAIVSFGNLGSVAQGATLDFAVTTGSNGAVQFSSVAPTLTNGILGGWATIGNDFATVSGTGVNVAAYAAYTPSTGDFSGTTSAVNNVKLTITAGTTVTLAGNSTINSLNLNSSGNGVNTLNLGGHTLDLNTGDLLIQNNTTADNLVNGVLTAGTTSAASELILTANTASQNVNIGAVIADNAAGGPVSLVIAGNAGTAFTDRLTGANTYTGNTYLEQGTTYILTDRQLGAEPTTQGGSQLFLTNGAALNYNGVVPASFSANRGITLGAGGGSLNLGSGYMNLASTISGTGPLTFSNTNYFLSLTLSGANTFDGVLSAYSNLVFTSIGNIGGGASALGAPTTAWNGRIVMNVPLNGSTLDYVGVGAAVTDRQIEFTGGSTYSGALMTGGAGSLTLNGNIIQQNGTGSLKLMGYGLGIINGNILQIESTALNINKGPGGSGYNGNTGTWELLGQNTYAGTTTVTQGVLAFNTIGNVGAGASSLGAPATVANGTIALAGGDLRFMGNTAQNSDRILSVSQNSQLDTIGSAPITYTGGVTFTAGKTLTLGGTGSGFLSGSVGLTGSSTLTEQGALGLGVWTLNQSATNGFLGTIQVNAGTLNLDFSNLSSPTNLINSTVALTLGGGTLGILGKSAGTNSQTFASLTTTAATASVLNLTAPGGGSMSFATTTPAWTLGAGSTLDIETSGNVTITGTIGLVGGINNTITVGGTNFATMLTPSTIGASNSGTYSALVTTTGSLTGVYQLQGSQVQTGAIAFSALKIVPTGSGQSLNLSGNVLGSTQNNMSILFDGSQYGYTITSGTVGNTNTNWNLDLITAGTNALTLASQILSSGNTSISTNSIVNKAGTGTLILSGSNTYKQETVVESGTLAAGSSTGFSANSTFLVNAGAVLATNGAAPGILALSGNGLVENGAAGADTLTIGASNTNGGWGYNAGTTTFGGMITNSGAGSLSLVKAGYGTQILTSGDILVSNYTGSTTVTSGILEVYNLADSGVASSIGAGSAINLGSFGQLGVLQVGTNLTINNESNRTVTLAAGGAGAIDVQNGALSNGSGITLGSPNLQNGTLYGALVTLSGNVTGAGELEKLGTGNLVLSGVNNYTGGTYVEFGNLQFASSASVPSTGLITVTSGGTVSTGYAINQAFLNQINSTSTGVVALGSDSSNSLDFTNLPNTGLGATGSYIFSGTLIPGGGTYQLGGGGMVTSRSVQSGLLNSVSVLTIANANTITGTNNVVVSPHGSAGGMVIFADAQNYTGSTTVSGGINNAYNSIAQGYGTSGANAGIGSTGWFTYALTVGELDVTGSLSTSSVTLNQLGILKLVASAAGGQYLQAATPINLLGGNFEFLNDGSTTSFALSTGTLNLGQGGSQVVSLGAVAGQTSILTFAGFTRAVGTTIEFSGPNLGASTNQILFTTNSSNSNPTLATPWAFVSGASSAYAADNATDFAIINPTTGLVTAANGAVILSATTPTLVGGDYTMVASGTTVIMSGTYVNTSGTYFLASGTSTANTLRMGGLQSNNNAQTGVTVTGSAGYVLAVNGLMNNASYTNGASPNFIIGTGSDGGVMTATGTSGGEIVLNPAGISGNNIITIYVNANITNNGGAVSLTKTGYGNLYLSGSNSFTGGIVVDGYGQVIATGTNLGYSFGTGPITMNSGGVVLTGTTTGTVIANNWIINGDSAVRFDGANATNLALGGSMTLNNNATFWVFSNNSNNSYSINSPINGTGNLGIQTAGGNGPVIIGGTGNNSFTGTTYITGAPSLTTFQTSVVSLEKLNTSGSNVSAISGNILLGSNNPIQSAYPSQEILILNNSGLLSGSLSNEQIAATSLITFQGGNGYDAGVLRLNNQSDTIAGIQSAVMGDGLIQNNSNTTGTSTLTLQTVSGRTTNFSGLIQDHDNSNSNVGKLALTVTGAGTQQLSNVSTYSGTTTVTGSATLIVSGSLTSSSVSVNTSTATLGGSGGIAQNVTVTNGGHLAPGLHSAGTNYGGPSATLTLASAGTLTLTSANLDFDLDTTAASSNNDKIATGALSLGSTIIFNFSQLTPGTLEIGQLYTLISASSISGFSAGNISTTWVNGTPYTATYSVVGNNLDVTFTAVPEPGTWAMLVGGLSMLSCFQRPRRNR